MALDLSVLNRFGAAVGAVLAQVQGELPVITSQATKVGEEAAKLFETVKAHLGALGVAFSPTMTAAETQAALDAASLQLQADMDAVDAAPRTGQTE